MAVIKRDSYVERLMSKRQNGRVKIVTGIRRCGKSFILTKLFKERLLAEGVPEDHFIEVALDSKENEALRNGIVNGILPRSKDIINLHFLTIYASLSAMMVECAGPCVFQEQTSIPYSRPKGKATNKRRIIPMKTMFCRK